MAVANLEETEIFDLLESNNMEIVNEIKADIEETFNKIRENWLVHGLYDYFMWSGSSRCREILCGISKEPHDRFLIEKMTEGIRSPSKDGKRQTLIFLGHLISKQPSWLYKIIPLFKELTRLLRSQTETDVVVLLSGLLPVIMLIPMLPKYISPQIQDVFEVFGRLATLSLSVPKEYVFHLQVGLYSLFHRLYAMYPCNFLSYLRHNFSSVEKRTLFFHTIMPMLEKVKMHPALVTGTREGELHPQCWKNKEYHEVIAECSKISLDVYESSFPEEVTPTFSRLGNLDIFEGETENKESSSNQPMEWTIESLLKLPTSSLISQAMRSSDLTSLVTYLDDSCNTAPPTPLSVGNSGSASMIINKTASPPETAMEATPENTPIKDRERLSYRFPPPPNSPAAMQLNFTAIEQIKEKYSRSLFPAATPTNSVPSSPLPAINNNNSSTEFPYSPSLIRRDSIFDTAIGGSTLRKDSLIFQRLQKGSSSSMTPVQLEQQQQQQQQQLVASQENADTPSSLEPLQQSTSITNTPIGSPIPSSVSRTSAFAQRKNSVPSPICIPSSSQQEPELLSATSITSDFLSDREMPTGGPLTPMLPSTVGPQQSTNLEIDLSLMALDEEPSAEECQSAGGAQCIKGGLHMADHKQMMAFAKRVSRLRFHSQCAPAPLPLEINNVSFGTSPSSNSSTGLQLQQFKSRIIKRSYSLPNIQKRRISETESSTDIVTIPEKVEAGTQIDNVPNDNGADDHERFSTTQQHPDGEQLQPYEHLFQQILPTVLSPPVDSRTLPSPHLLLDLCLLKAANLHNAKAKSDEISLLRGQIALLHGQLLFERHRREAHALRNRRLAGKCKEMQTMEEKNYSMKQEIHNLEKEIILLKQEILTQRSMGLNREKALELRIPDFEKKLEDYRTQVTKLKDDKIQMEIKHARLQEEFTTLQKESDEKKAHLFCLDNDIINFKRQLEFNNELKSAYEISQKEIIVLGELLRRHQEKVYQPIDSQRYFKEEIEDIRQTFEEEIRKLKNSLDNRMSQCEASNGTIQDLEKKLEKREAIIMQQSHESEELHKEHRKQLQEWQKKYEFVKTDNQKLEMEIINLQHQLTMKTSSSRSARGRMTSSPSNNGELSPNSNHSDVDSAASAAGYQLSPDRNACFFGSPQFDFPSDEMKDLHQVLDQGQPSSTEGTRRNSLTQDKPS